MSTKYILHIVSWYPHENDPFEGDFIERHIQCISNAIDGVVYFSKAHSKSYSAVIPNIAGKVSVYRRYFKKSNPISEYVKHHAYIRPDIDDIIKIHGIPDLVHSHAPYPGLSIANYIAGKYKIPHIHTEHSTIYMNTHMSIKDKILFKYIAKYISKADKVVPVSEQLKLTIHNKIKNTNLEVIPNIVSNSFFETMNKPIKTGTKLIHISSMEDDHKNISGILQAFKKVLTKKACTLTLVSSVGKSKVEYLLKKNGLDTKHIKIVGSTIYDEIPKILAAHDIFILWSRYESFSIVLAEAWASGLPVITSLCGGLTNEVTRENGLLVKEYHTDQLANAILELTETYANFNYQSIRQEAKERFSESIVLSKYLKVYQQLGLDISN